MIEEIVKRVKELIESLPDLGMDRDKNQRRIDNYLNLIRALQTDNIIQQYTYPIYPQPGSDWCTIQNPEKDKIWCSIRCSDPQTDTTWISHGSLEKILDHTTIHPLFGGHI